MTYSVLIVEDETTLASNMAKFLGRHGYETRIADTAESALHELQTFKPHTIVLDYNLPGNERPRVPHAGTRLRPPGEAHHGDRSWQ